MNTHGKKQQEINIFIISDYHFNCHTYFSISILREKKLLSILFFFPLLFLIDNMSMKKKNKKITPTMTLIIVI
jgi:hypothetical protein